MAMQSERDPIRVVIVDDHPLLLEGTRRCLDAAEGIAIVGEATEGKAALDLIGEQLPDVLLLDVQLPDISGVEVARHVRASFPRVAVLVLTGHDEAGYVRSLLKAGIAGYLRKTASADELVAAVRAVAKGRTVLVSEAASPILFGEIEVLTEREHEVLQHLAAGLSNAEIARALYVSQKTVEFHISHILQKLGARSRVQALLKAREHGLLEAGT
jgi:DNA-binding NarL/FixJ family response regulator